MPGPAAAEMGADSGTVGDLAAAAVPGIFMGERTGNGYRGAVPPEVPPLKISVITPVYNSEATVGEAIASVARQSWPAIEHIIIEGRSTDRSLAAIEGAAHARMTLCSEPDEGIYDALNKGLARAGGDVIGFVHSDDFLAHDRVLERVAEVFSDPAVEAVFSDLDYVSGEDTARIIRHWRSGPFERRRLSRGWMPPHPTLYLRRRTYEELGGFDPGFRIAADYDFMLRFFTRTSGACVYVPEVTYKMRLGGASNRDWRQIGRKMLEDYQSIRRNNAGGIMTLAAKNVSKIGQFAIRPKPDRPA